MEDLDLTTLTSEELIEVAQTALEKKQQAEDAYKQNKSSSSKWAQLLLDVIDYSKKHKWDINKLAEIEESKPELARLIQEKLYDGKTSDDLRPKVSQEVQSQIDDVIEQLPESMREKFQEEFNDITEWKTVSKNNLEKFVKATMWIIQGNVDLSIEEQAKIWSLGSDGKKTTSKWEDAQARLQRQNEIAKQFDNF